MKCFCEDCIHCHNDECDYSDGYISIDCCGSCIEFEDYTNLPEYKQRFWRRVKIDGVEYKREDFGKREKKNGIVFYHFAKELCEGTGCTEERTGIAFLYKHLDMPDMLAQMKDKMKQYSNVTTLPEEPNVVRWNQA